MKSPAAQPQTSSRIRKEGMNTICAWENKLADGISCSDNQTFFRPWKNVRTLSLLPLGVGGMGGALYQNATRVIRNEAMAGIA